MFRKQYSNFVSWEYTASLLLLFGLFCLFDHFKSLLIFFCCATVRYNELNYVLLYLTNCNFSPYHYRRKRQDLYGRFSIITPGHYSWRDYLCSSLRADTYFKWNCDIYKYRPSRFSYAIFFWTYRPIQRFSWRNHMPEVFDSSLTVRILWCLKKSTGILQINFRNKSIS